MKLLIALLLSISAQAQSPCTSPTPAPLNWKYVSNTGNDADPGTLMKPWKTLSQAAKSVKPGDQVMVQSGVYNETVTMQVSGTKALPIKFKAVGNVTLSGAPTIKGWTKCTTDPRIYCIDYTGNFTAEHLVEGNKVLHPAMYPDQKHEFYKENIAEFLRPLKPSGNNSSIIDPAGMSSITDLTGAYVGLFIVSNHIIMQPVLSFDSALKKITFADLSTLRATQNYALYNHVSFLKRPGSFALSGGKLYVIPFADINQVGVSKLGLAFNMNGKSFVEVDGFTMTGYGSGAVDNVFTKPATGIVISNNTVTGNFDPGNQGAINLASCTDCQIDGNTVTYNKSRAISAARGFGGTISSNKISMNWGTGIFLQQQSKTVLSKNVISDNNGIHANGISVYQYSSDVEVSDNDIRHSNFAITIQASKNTKILRNFIDDSGGVSPRMIVVYGPWNNTPNDGTLIERNTVMNCQGGAVFVGDGSTNTVMRSNILDGYYPPTQQILVSTSNNLYLGYNWFMKKDVSRAIKYPLAPSPLFTTDFKILKSAVLPNGFDKCSIGAFGCEP